MRMHDECLPDGDLDEVIDAQTELDVHEQLGDPYVRLVLAVFLQAVADYLTYLRARNRGRPIGRWELDNAISAVDFLRGCGTVGITLTHVEKILDLDVQQLYNAPHAYVETMTRALRRGRRRLSDY